MRKNNHKYMCYIFFQYCHNKMSMDVPKKLIKKKVYRIIISLGLIAVYQICA